MLKKLLLIICLSVCLFGASQENNKTLDSLKSVLKKQKNVEQFHTLKNISNFYLRTNVDSSLFYAKKAFKLSEKLKVDSISVKAYILLGDMYWERGNFPESILNINKSLAISTKIKDTNNIAHAYNNLGIVYGRLGKYNTSIPYFIKSIKLYEKLNDDIKIAAAYTNIASDFRRLKEPKKASDYYKKSLMLYEKFKDSLRIAMLNNNIAGNLNDLGQYEKSIKFSNLAISYYTKLKFERYTAYPISNIAISYDSLHNYDEAKKNYLKAIGLHSINREPYELAFLNNALANLNYNLKDYKNAVLIGKEAFHLANQVEATQFIVSSSKTLAKTYEKLNNFKESNKYLKVFIKFNDSLINTEKIKTIADIETKYETEKKEKEILSQRADLAEKELNINQKNTQILGLGILALVVAVLGYLLFNQQKLKNSQLQKENELKEALIKIESQNKLQEQRLNISRDLHDNIGAQLTFIISSIDNLQYGFKISDTKLTNKLSGISSFTKETIYELRDTIWAMNKNDISLEDLQVRISNFIDKGQIAASGITFSFNRDEELLDSLKFTSVKGMNIYRIVQEAINNAMKYANAQTIVVNFLKDENNIKIAVIDDGIGFDMNKIEYGNGLNNMKKRAQEMGSNIIIVSKINEGTTITFEV